MMETVVSLGEDEQEIELLEEWLAILSAVDYFNKKYIYEGDGKIENNYFCVDMTSKGLVVNDSTHHRYNVTKIDEKDLCYGFWLSTDFNGMVSCGSVILTKDKISAAMLDSLVKEYFETFNNIPFLSVK